MEQCQFCGSNLGAKSRFCTNCGKPVIVSNATELSAKKVDSVISGEREIKTMRELGTHFDGLSQLKSKNKKPQPSSIDAIRHTLFVVPDNFLKRREGWSGEDSKSLYACLASLRTAESKPW
jgi:hypothetical protein